MRSTRKRLASRVDAAGPNLIRLVFQAVLKHIEHRCFVKDGSIHHVSVLHDDSQDASLRSVHNALPIGEVAVGVERSDCFLLTASKQGIQVERRSVPRLFWKWSIGRIRGDLDALDTGKRP